MTETTENKKSILEKVFYIFLPLITCWVLLTLVTLSNSVSSNTAYINNQNKNYERILTLTEKHTEILTNIQVDLSGIKNYLSGLNQDLNEEK